MLAKLVLPILLLVFSALPAAAVTFDRCEKTEIGVVADSLKASQKLAVRAAVVIGNTAEYDRWFGRYTAANAEVVRANFKSINRALQSDQVHIICPNNGEDGCKGDTFAYVSNPRACAHRFHEHVATDSTMMWPPIPRHVATLLR